MQMKALAIFAAAAVLATCAKGEQIVAEPDALLDYIEATGSQYIDTGVNAETGLKASIDFAWANQDLSDRDWSLLDACTYNSNDANKRSRFFMCHMLNGKPYFAYGLKQRRNPANSVSFVGGERCEIITDMSSTNSLELTQNGMNTFDDTDRETFATNGNVNLHLNLFVFATNYGGSPSSYGQGRLYEMKIFRKNAATDEFDLLRHYIPCTKDNRAGLYDKVNGTISFSASSTNFIAGTVATTVTVTKFNQSYPYSGRATVEYTIGGTLPANAFAEITLRADGASATFVQSNVVAGANSYVVDFASSFGGVLLLTNASFVVTINPGDDGLGGVQLWSGGPYWAECNVGASEPEEYGYYFWWGDTVGYTRSGGTWDERNSRFYDVTWVSSTGEQMDSSPFVTNSCPTSGKDNSTLQSEGWIDATTNLVAAHDAATAYLGTPWRMPTYDEIQALVDNCTTTWITNGVHGRLVTGMGAYANRSIFLPAAGYGIETNLYSIGSYGYYWSSTPFPGRSSYAWSLYFLSRNSSRKDSVYRYRGIPVRPVRGFAGCSASGNVTYDSSTPYENWAAANGVAGAWDATDASGLHNVFRYVFDVPTGAITNPPLIDIAIEGETAVVITPPVSNTVGFAVSVVESDDVAGAAVTRRKPLDSKGRTEFPMGSAASRFYRLSATEGDVSPGGVQLWENGPYWAQCNVGASEPEEYGYYFWWGDTVGYTRSGGTLGLFGLYSSVTWVSSTGEQMSSSPFSIPSCPTYGKDNSALQSEGWIDSTGNLVPEYDAATAHLGAPWRMPTDAEFFALTNNCTATWITTNGVSGRLVTGKGAYADRSIFLPAAGYGSGSNFGNPNSHGYYWSSTPDPGDSHLAWYLDFNSSLFQRYIYYGRQYGQSVRPVRDAN